MCGERERVPCVRALNTAIAELQNHAARNASNKQGADHSVTVVDTVGGGCTSCMQL